MLSKLVLATLLLSAMAGDVVADIKFPAQCQYSKYPGVDKFDEQGHADAFAAANKGLIIKKGIGLIKPSLNIWDGPSKFELKKKVDLSNLSLQEILAVMKENGFEKGAALVKTATVEDDSGKDLKVMVGSTFDERVIKADVAALVEFYAPWCGACKELAPEFEKVATAMKGKVLVAKMDVTANAVDHPEVKVTSFPTILFFPRYDKSKPITYTGARETTDIIKFIETEIEDDEEDPGECIIVLLCACVFLPDERKQCSCFVFQVRMSYKPTRQTAVIGKSNRCHRHRVSAFCVCKDCVYVSVVRVVRCL